MRISKPKLKRFVNRSAAVFLTISLLFSSTGQAAPVVSNKTENIPAVFQTAIPKGFGKVEESFAGTSGKTIYYIQDAHDSLEAQKHIAGLIRHFVKREGVRTVFEEGYEGPVPTGDYFGFIKNPKIREKVSYFLMDKLRLGGAEYAHVNRPHLTPLPEGEDKVRGDFKLIGADSLALHRDNIRWYQKNAQSQQATSEDLAVLQAEIEKIAQKHLPKKLKDWIKLKKKFDRQELGLLDYLQRTNRLGIPFDDYPNIELILLAARGQDSAMKQRLAAMDAKELFKEIEFLETQVGRLLGGEGLSLKVVEYFRMLELYQRLNQISLTPAGYQVVKGLIKNFDTGKIAQFIVGQTGKSLAFSARWEAQIQNAVQFYETAHARDKKIEENLKAFLQNPDERKAVLVFGGFHKEAIKQILTRQNFSWAVITPKISQLDSRHSGYYKQLMSVGHHAFEKPFILNKAARAESIVQIGGRSEIRALYEAAKRLESPLFLSREFLVSAMERELLKTSHGSRSEVRVNPGIASILSRNYPETLAGAQEIIKDTIKWLIDDMHHEEEPLLREFSALIESAENMQDGGFNKSRNFLDAASPLKIQINAKLLYRYWQISKELLEKGVNPTSYYFETLAAPILRESRGALFIKNMRSNETLEVLRTINQQFPPIPRGDVFPSASGYTYIPLKDLIHRFVVYFGAGEFYEGIWHLKAFQWARENGLYDFKEIRALLDQKHIQTNDRYEHLFADDITQTDILAQEIKNHTVYALRQFVQYGLKYPGERAFYYFFLLQIGNKNFNGGRLPTDKLMQLVNKPVEVPTAEFIGAAQSIEAEMLQLFNHFHLTVPDEENLKRSETRTLKIQIQTLLTTFEREIQSLPLERFQRESLFQSIDNLSMHIPVNPDQLPDFIRNVTLLRDAYPLTPEIKIKFEGFIQKIKKIRKKLRHSERIPLNAIEEDFVQETRRDVFGPVYDTGVNAILENNIYTEESLNRKQVEAWGEASIRERVAGADGNPSVFYSLSAAIYPQGPDAEAIRRHWEKIRADFKSQPFAGKFYVPPFKALNLTLRWLAISSKTAHPQEKFEAAEITIGNIPGRMMPFDIWVQGLSIDPETGRIFAEVVFLNEKDPKPRFMPLFTPFNPLSQTEKNQLMQWIEENRDFIFGRIHVEAITLVHSRNIFAGDNISKKEYPLIVTRSEVRVTERIQRELWALDYVELSKNQTSLAKLVLDLKELEEKIQSLGMPDKRVAVIYPLVFSINAILKANPDFATPFVETKIKDALTRQIPAAKQAAEIEFIYESSKKRVEARFSYPDKAILLNYIIMGPQVNMYAEKSEENGGKVTARFHALLDGKISGTLDYFQQGAAQIVNQTTGQPLEIPAVDIEAAAPLLDYYIVFDWMTRSKTTDDEARRGANFLNNLFALYPGILADFYLPQFIESLEGTRFFYKDGEIHLYSDAGAKDGQIQNWLGEIKKSGKVMDIPPSKMADLVAALPVNQFVRDLVSPIELIAAPDVYAMAFHSLWDSPIIIHSVRYGQIKPTLEAAMQLAAVILSDERISIEITRSADQKSGEVITRYADPLNRELMLEWFAKSGNGESEGVVFFSIEEERDKGWYRVRKYIKDPQDFLRRRSEVRTTGNPKLWLNPNPPATMQKPEPAIHKKVLRDYEDLLKNVKKTPLVQLDRISQLTGKKVFLKNDAQQYGGSFKIRGVYWEVYSAIKALLKKPDAKQILRDGFKIVTQSTGNHGIAMLKSLELILAKLRAKYEKSDPELAQLLFNIEPLIFTLKEIPEPKYPAMQQALEDYRKLAGENKGEIRNFYDTYEAALEARKIFVAQQGDHAVYIRHASAETTFGYGSAGIEIAEQLKAAGIDEKQKVVLIFPVGAGGPIGFATGLRLARFENTYAVMAQSDRWDAFVRSLKTGRLEKNEQPIEPTDVIKNPDGTETAVWFTDGSAVDSPEEFAIDLAKEHLDAGVAVDERAAYDFSGPLLLADLKDHMGDLARVGGTTALTAEALLTQAGNISVIQDADVVVLFGTEGSVSPYVHTHLENQLPQLNTIKARYQKRSEVRHAPVFSADAGINQKIYEEIESNFVRKSEIPTLNLFQMLADYDGPQIIGVPSSLAGKDLQQIMRERGIESVETLKYYLLGSEDTVLDIGSGSKGGFAFILAMLGADVTSIEMAPWAIDALKKKYAELAPFIQKAGGKWKLIEGDFSNPELRKDLQGGFQHIIASDVIVPLRPGEKDRLAAETRPTTDPEKILSIIYGIAEVKSNMPGIVLLSLPTGSARQARPYEREVLNVVPEKTGLNLLSQKRVSVPFSLGIKSGLVLLFTGLGRRSEIRPFEDYQKAVALLVDKKDEVYKGLKLAAGLDDSSKTPQSRLIDFRKLMDRQANSPGKMIGKVEVLNSLFKSFDNSHFMKGDPVHDSRPDYSILNKVVEEMAANHPDFPATPEVVERTAKITFEYFVYQTISLLAFRAYEDWRGASPESGRDMVARASMATVQKMLEDFSATSFQKFDTDPLLSLQFLSSYLSFYETEYYKLDKFIEILGPEALARWDEYTLRLIGRHLRGVFHDSYRLWEHRWINVADFALLIISLNRELARYQAAKQSKDEPAIKRHVQNILEGLSSDPVFLTTKEDLGGLIRAKDPVMSAYDEGSRIYPTDNPVVWESYWNLLELLKKPLREDMIQYAEPQELGYSSLGRMDLYWAALGKYMILASILKSGHERLGFRDLLESDPSSSVAFKDASEKLRWNWWIDYRGKKHLTDSLDALRYYNRERVNTHFFAVLAALKPRSEMRPNADALGQQKLSGTARSEMRNRKTLNDWRNEQGVQILRGGKDGLGSSDDEQISLTDGRGMRNGKSAAKTEAHQKGLWHETAHGYFFYKGQIVLQVRSQKKKSSPGKFQVSISGHLNIEDETVADGLRREGQEESGILLNQKKIRQVSHENEIRRSYQSAEGMNNEFTTVYDYELDDNELEMIRQGYNLNEIDEFWMIPIPVFERMIEESPYLFSSSLIHLISQSRLIYKKMKARALENLQKAAGENAPSEKAVRNPFEVMNSEILRMFNQLQGMVTDPATPLSLRLLEKELKLIPYSKKLGRFDGKSLPAEESAALLVELAEQRNVLTGIKNNPAYQMDLKPGVAGLFDAHLQYLIGQIDVLTAILSPRTGTVTPDESPRSEVRPNADALRPQSSSGTGRSEVREKQNPPTKLSDLIGEKMTRVVDYATGLGDWPRELRGNSHKWLAVNSEMIPVDLDDPIEYPMYQKKGGFGSVKDYQRSNLNGLEVITPSTWDGFLEPDDAGKIKEIDLLHAAFLHNPPTTLNDLDKFETNVRVGGWVLIAHTNRLYHQNEMIKWLKGRGYEDGNIYVYDRDTGFPMDYPTTYWWNQYVRLRQNYIIVAQKTRNPFRSEVRENAKSVEARPIEKMSIPAGVFLDAKELALMPAAQLDKQLDEILTLVSRHKAFDVYIDGANRLPVQQFKNPKIQKMLSEHSDQIHLGMHDRANLAKKQILIHASFLEGVGSRSETRNLIEDLRKRYGVKAPVSALEYRQAGSLKAFLDLAERFKPGELIRDIGEAFAVLGPNGRWRVSQDFVATIWHQVQASYRIQWSA